MQMPPAVESTPTSRSPRKSWRAQVLLVAALGALGAIAAACGGGSPTPSPTASANSLISKGLSAESSGQYQQALSDFNQAATDNPASAIAYFDLGAVYQERLNNPTAAEGEYNKALLADPVYAPAMFNLATIETKSDPQGAITLYNQLLRLNPNDANSNFNLGLLLISQGQTAQGQSALTKAIFLKPSLKSRVPAGITP